MPIQQGPLPKQFVQVSLTAGLNKKRDGHQLQNGELLTADNVVYSAVDGQVTKRFGYRQVQPQGAPFQGGPFTAIGCRDEKEPLVLGQNTLNRYNVNQNLSTALPLPTQGRIDVAQVVSSTGRTKNAWPPSHAHVAIDDSGKYACVVWEEPNETGAILFYGIQDQTNGVWIISPQLIPRFSDAILGYAFVTSAQPQVNYANGYFFVSFLYNGKAIDSTAVAPYRTFLIANTIPLNNLAGGFTAIRGTIDLSLLVTMDANSNANQLATAGSVCYDLHIANGQYVYSTLGDTSGSEQGAAPDYLVVETGNLNGRVLFRRYKGQLTLPASLAGTNGGYYNLVRMAVKANGPADRPFVVATEVATWTLTPLGVSTQYTMQQTGANKYYSGSPVDALFVGDKLYFTSYGLDVNNVGCIYLYCTDKTLASPVQVKCTPPVGSYLLEQLSRLFVLPSGRICFWVGAGSNTSDDSYNSAYLLEVDPAQSVQGARCIARTLYQSNANNNVFDKTTPCEVFQVRGTSQFVTFISQETEKNVPPGGESWRAYGTLNRVSFDFAPARQIQVVALPTGGNLIAGAMPRYYDGAEVTEAGFSAAPDYTVNSPANTSYPIGATVPVANNTGGSMAPQTYTYLCCFVRRDAYGNVYRSAFSSPITVVVPSGGRSSVTFRPLYYAGGGSVRVEYYRNTPTLAGQAAYYFVGSAPVLSPSNSVYANFVDTAADGTITGSRILNLDETPCDPPPAIYHMALSDTRAFCIPADNRNQVWASKLFSPGRTVEWNSSQYVTEGQNAGLFTGIAVLDNNVIVFKADSICYFYGTGPDNSGAGGGFSSLQKLATDVGCIDAASIKVTPDGVVFRSRRGIEMLTRNLQINYIGSNVEPLVQTIGPMSSVVIMPGYTELRFVPATPGQPVLCYDYGQKRWSTFGAGASGLGTWASVQAAQILGDYWWIAADGSTLNIETPGYYLDAGQPVVMTLETAEVPVGGAGPVGWGRLYRLGLLGDFYTQHKLNVSFQYDHQGTYTDTVVFDTASGLVASDSVYQFRCSRVPRQRMQSVRFKIQDSAVIGQSCAISALVLEVGDKSGLARLPSAKSL